MRKSHAMSEPSDNCHFVFVVFKLLGMASLLPWNFFVSVSGYWMYKFRDVRLEEVSGFNATLGMETGVHNEEEGLLTPLQTKWSSYLSIASMLPNLLVLILNAVVGHHFSLLPRIFISFMLIVILFVFNCIMTQVSSDQWQQAFMDMTLVSVVAMSTTSAIVQGGVSALAAKFPPPYMGAVVQGQTLGGIVAAATNVIFLVLGTSHVEAAFLCFSVAVVFTCASVGAFLTLTRSHFFHYYFNQQDLQQEAEKMVKACDDNEVIVKSQDLKNIRVLTIASQIHLWIAIVFITFMVTLIIFPTLAVLVVSEDHGKGYLWNDRLFTPVGCFLLFNIGEYCGRILAGITQWPGHNKHGSTILLLISVLRAVLVPLFLLCNASPKNRVVTSVVFESDAVFLGLMALLSFSGGYIGTVAMMFGPKSIQGHPQAQSTAASILVAFLVLGLAVGSMLSFAVLMLL